MDSKCDKLAEGHLLIEGNFVCLVGNQVYNGYRFWNDGHRGNIETLNPIKEVELFW